MSSTDQGVRRAEGYLYNSLHQAFPILPIVVVLASLDGPTRPMGWLVGWGALVLAAAWAGLTVLHTRLRDLALLPASGWDRWFRSRRQASALVAWIVFSLAAAGTAGLFVPADLLLLTACCSLLGGVLALPALLVGVAGLDDFPASRLRTGTAVVTGIALSLVALWVAPATDMEMVRLRFSATLITAWIAAMMVGFGSMFVNVIAATRALEKARVDEARLAVAEERVRFARDLHDVFGRTLSAVALKSELAAAQAERGRPEASATMREVQAIAAGALTEVREVVRGYREADLAGEVAGAKALLEAAGSRVTTTLDGGASLPAPVARAFAWTVREAATNVLRHADAAVVRISVGARGEEARLEVVNDRPHAASGSPGSGLAGLTERLAEVGGTLTWRHDPDAFSLVAVVDASALAHLRSVMDEPIAPAMGEERR